jgi:hypothetical protein
MSSMRAVLEARQKAAAVLVEELEAELERVREALTEAEEVFRRRVIGLEQYLEALAEEDAPAVAVVSQRKPVGPRRAVPHRDDAAGTEMLSVDYQALMAAALEAGTDGLGARGAGLGQRFRLPCRRSAGPAETAGGTGMAGRGETGQVDAARAGAGRCWRRAAKRRLMSVVIDHRMTVPLVSGHRS